MQSVTTSTVGFRQALWPLPRPCPVQNLANVLIANHVGIRHHDRRPTSSVRLRRNWLRVTRSAASEIVADVLNEEQKRTNPTSLLELLDQQGWGVTTEITRKFATKFASVTFEASWDDDTSGNGRICSRRLAILAIHQEWLVARSSLVGRLVDTLERLRPGYLPRELLERIRASRAAAGLTPDSEALDGPSLLTLAALVVPSEQLTALLDRVLAVTREELLVSPSYGGRSDLVPSLDRGLLLLRASAMRSVEMVLFRAAHIKEAVELEVQLRRQQMARQPRREESTSGVLGMWFRETKGPSQVGASTGAAASARAANERLYAGQVAPEAPPWMNLEERGRAATAAAGRSGPRGLPSGRVGLATFRPLPGAALYSYPGLSGSGSFGSSDRVSFSRLDASVKDLLAKADYEVPAAALSTFARLHRTALLDLLSSWQWTQLVGTEGDPAALRGARCKGSGIVRGFYSPRCSHATSLKPAGPLQVARRTRIDVAPGPELESLRALVRSRGSEVLRVVHPLAWKQVVSKGEWEYWREAYRLWGRYAPMPPSCRTSSVTLVLTPDQVPYVGILEAEAAGRAAAASVGVPLSAAKAAAADDLDMSSLTSMSSLDFDDAPLPAGITILGTAATATTGSSSINGSGTSSSGGNDLQQGAGGAVGRTSVQTETTVQLSVPPEELRRFLLALLDLLPSHVGEGTGASTLAAAAAAVAAGSPPQSQSPLQDRNYGGQVSGSSPALGEWLPADATTLQIRYCHAGFIGGMTGEGLAGPGAAAGAAGGATAQGSVTSSVSRRAGAAASPSTAAATSRIPEELQLSCYELRWSLGSATLTTAPAGPSASSSYSTINISSRALSPGKLSPASALRWGASLGSGSTSTVASAASTAAVLWCAPMRLTQAQLFSLVNIFTDLAQQLPDLYGIQPQRLVVPTLSPLERLISAMQGAAGSVGRAVGLLALLAVPLVAAVKAGGGDLNEMMRGAGPSGGGARFGSSLAAAAAATVRSVQLPKRDILTPRSTPSAEAFDAATPEAVVVQRSDGTTAHAASIPAAEVAALCRRVEAAVEGRMWLEVSGTPAAAAVVTGAIPRWLETSGLMDPNLGPERRAVALASWPEFQVVVERCSGGKEMEEVKVLGCKPVNAAARAVLSELPFSAVLRGRAAEKAVSEHLAGLTRARIEQGKATPGRFDMQYQAAKFQKLPSHVTALVVPELESAASVTFSSDTVLEQQSVASAWEDTTVREAMPGVVDVYGVEAGLQSGPTPVSQRGGHQGAADVISGASPSPSSTAPALVAPSRTISRGAEASRNIDTTGTASGASVAVLKLELRPSLDPGRHLLQGKSGKQQREFAQADVVVRPWYDSDSLLHWLESSVQLPTLATEMANGLLAQEEQERTAFLQAYENLAGIRTDATLDLTGAPGKTGSLEGVMAPVTESRGEPAAGPQTGTAHPGVISSKSRGNGAVGVGASSEDLVLKPQQLSEQQLQEALQQLLISLGVPETNVRVASSGAGSAKPVVPAAVGDGRGGRNASSSSSSR